MANLGNFNAQEVEPMAEFTPLPAGKYLVVISESEMKSTKAGNGTYLQFTFEILEGEFKGPHLWSRLNLNNPNETAVKIARAELSAICRAVGMMAPNDSVELHNLPLVISVRCKKRKDTDEIVNEIKGYAKKDAATGQPQQAQSSDPPWRRS